MLITLHHTVSTYEGRNSKLCGDSTLQNPSFKNRGFSLKRKIDGRVRALRNAFH